ncbi:Kelch-like protein [Brazilian porcupinepox virus 1]|nr:Kelch-like protein [Brazilian porcupinepox virus 1]
MGDSNKVYVDMNHVNFIKEIDQNIDSFLILNIFGVNYYILKESLYISETFFQCDLSQYSSYIFNFIVMYLNNGYITLNEENVVGIFNMSEKLSIEFLKSSCINHINNIISIENCLKFLRYGFNIGSVAIYNISVEFILKSFNEMIRNGMAFNMSFKELEVILKFNNLCIDSEDSILDFLIKWHVKNNNNHDIVKLLKYVLRTDFLSNIGKNTLYSLLLKLDVDINFLGGDNKTPRNYIVQNNLINQNNICIDINKINNVKRILNSVNFYSSTVLFNDILYIVGGGLFFDCKDKARNNVIGININTFDIIYVPPMNVSRKNPGVVIFNDRLFVIGGVGNECYKREEVLKSVESWKPGDNGWEFEKDLIYSRYNPSVFTVNNKIYVVGGTMFFDKSVEVYSPLTKLWEFGRRSIFSHFGSASIVHNDHVYIIGGKSLIGNYFIYNCVESYNIQTDKWENETFMNHDRFNPSVCVMDNDNILVIGGYMSREYVKDVEMYNVNIKSWIDIDSVDLDNII